MKWVSENYSHFQVKAKKDAEFSFGVAHAVADDMQKLTKNPFSPAKITFTLTYPKVIKSARWISLLLTRDC